MLLLVNNRKKNMKDIYVKKKNVYGNELIYPDCDISVLLSRLMPSKTFSSRDITTLKLLGYKIRTKAEEI